MKKANQFIFLVFAVIFAGCSSTPKSTGVWLNKEKLEGKAYKKLLITMVTADIQVRRMLEDDLATAAKARGFEVVKSYEVIAFSLQDPKPPAKEEIVNQVKATGCDAVLVASLLRKDEPVNYSPGSAGASGVPANVNLTGSYGFGYYSYYINALPIVTSPGYYTVEQDFFMLSNLFDAATEELMMSIKSEIFNPENLQKFSQGYVTTLVKQLEKANAKKK